MASRERLGRAGKPKTSGNKGADKVGGKFGGKGAGLAEAPPHYYDHRERLRTRFRDAGSDALTDYELLEIVLFRSIPRRDFKPLCKQLVAKCGSFGEVLAAPEKRLAEIRGLGEATITDLKIIHAAASRLAKGNVQ
jgi:DNA repair protein RadC